MRGLPTLLAAAAALPLVASSVVSSSRYPIEPRTLRKLVAEAQFIITATVSRREPDSSRNQSRAEDSRHSLPRDVVLAVEAVLKGKLETKTIPQSNDFGMTCPKPALYEPGTHVLVFLDWTKEWGYFAHARSYGSKRLDDGAMKSYVERVKEELAILAMKDATEQRRAQVEWLVKCCEDPATRWEGAFDLAPRGDPISHYFDDLFLASSEVGGAGSKTPMFNLDEGFARELTEKQRQRLRDAWYSSKRFSLGEMCLDELFLAERDPKAIEWFVARLREQLKLRQGDEDEDDTAQLLERLARRDDRPAVAALAKKFNQSLIGYSLNSQLLPYRVKLLSDVLALY